MNLAYGIAFPNAICLMHILYFLKLSYCVAQVKRASDLKDSKIPCNYPRILHTDLFQAQTLKLKFY